MVKYSVHIKGLIVPVAGIICLEFLWNILGSIINPMLLNIPLHLAKYGLYALAGYIVTKFFSSETIEAVVHGGIAGGLGAIIEGFLVSPLFYGWFFYMPGFPFFHALYHIISLSITGAIFGFIGSFLSGMSELDFVVQYVQEIFDNPLMNEPKLNVVLNIGNESLPEVVDHDAHTSTVDEDPPQDNGTSSQSRDPKGIATITPVTQDENSEEEKQRLNELYILDLRARGYTDEDLRLLNKLFDGREPHWLEDEDMEIKRILLKIYDGQEIDAHSGLTEEERQEIEKSINSEWESENFNELSEEDQRTIANSMPLDVVPVYYHVTEKDIRKIVEMRVRSVVKSGSYDEDFIVDKKIKNQIFRVKTQAALKEAYKESEKAKSYGILNGIRRLFQKLARSE